MIPVREDSEVVIICPEKCQQWMAWLNYGKNAALIYFDLVLQHVITIVIYNLWPLMKWTSYGYWPLIKQIITGWWLSHPSGKYERQLGWLFPIYGKHVPNHQPDDQHHHHHHHHHHHQHQHQHQHQHHHKDILQPTGSPLLPVTTMNSLYLFLAGLATARLEPQSPSWDPEPYVGTPNVGTPNYADLPSSELT